MIILGPLNIPLLGVVLAMSFSSGKVNAEVRADSMLIVAAIGTEPSRKHSVGASATSRDLKCELLGQEFVS